MTVNEYRKKHKRCSTCKHLSTGTYLDRCLAKRIEFSDSTSRGFLRLRGCFCEVYEPKEYKENDR